MSTLRRFGLGLLLTLALTGVAPGALSDESPVRIVNGLEVYVHGARSSAYDPLWDAIPARVERIRSQLGADVLQQGEIHAVPDINDFFRDRGDSARAPRWAQAVALPSRHLIVLRMPDPNAVTTLTHELSHLAVHDAAAGQHVPRWFLEGFAMYQAEEWGVRRTVSIGQAAMFDNTIPFENLDTEFPPHWLSAGLAYAQSFHFVRQLLEDYGPAAVQAWLDGVARGQPWQASFEEAFGTSPAVAFAAWRESVRVWYGWIPAVVSVTTLWTLVSVLAIWAFRRVRRRRRMRLAAMEAAERELYPPDPDDDLFS